MTVFAGMNSAGTVHAQERATTSTQDRDDDVLLDNIFDPLRSALPLEVELAPGPTSSEESGTSSDTTVIIEKEEDAEPQPTSTPPAKEEIKSPPKVEVKETKKVTPAKKTVKESDDSEIATSTEPFTILSTNVNDTVNPYLYGKPLSIPATATLLSMSALFAAAGILLAQRTLLERIALTLSHFPSRRTVRLRPSRGHG